MEDLTITIRRQIEITESIRKVSNSIAFNKKAINNPIEIPKYERIKSTISLRRGTLLLITTSRIVASVGAVREVLFISGTSLACPNSGGLTLINIAANQAGSQSCWKSG